ncbi:MAG: hypothetical protein OEV86_16035 [Candidatus Krumholzibacteria bacterium]|nr:hypothetical protein [Candidatus Krumholzibacteria bacterium]
MGLVTDSKLEEELAWMRKLINTTQSIKTTSTQHAMSNIFPSYAYEKAISVTTKQAIEAIIDYLGIELRVEPGKTVPEKVVASKAKKKE